MRDVDYVKLSEQYAGFLIAIGGVSITVLSIVSALYIPPSGDKVIPPPLELDKRLFLSAALIVSTVCCFIGAHMMAETAAFVSYFKNILEHEGSPWVKAQQRTERIPEWTPAEAIIFGKRLFLFASTTIFIAVILVLFSIVLLPATSTAKEAAPSISPIYSIIFVFVGIGTLLWMVLASQFRMPVSKTLIAIFFAGLVGLIWWKILTNMTITDDGVGFWEITKGGFLVLTFFPIVLVTVLSLINFAWIFKDSNKKWKRAHFWVGYKIRRPEVGRLDVFFFGSAVIISYASLVAAGIRLGALTFVFQ